MPAIAAKSNKPADGLVFRSMTALNFAPHEVIAAPDDLAGACVAMANYCRVKAKGGNAEIHLLRKGGVSDFLNRVMPQRLNELAVAGVRLLGLHDPEQSLSMDNVRLSGIRQIRVMEPHHWNGAVGLAGKMQDFGADVVIGGGFEEMHSFSSISPYKESDEKFLRVDKKLRRLAAICADDPAVGEITAQERILARGLRNLWQTSRDTFLAILRDVVDTQNWSVIERAADRSSYQNAYVSVGHTVIGDVAFSNSPVAPHKIHGLLKNADQLSKNGEAKFVAAITHKDGKDKLIIVSANGAEVPPAACFIDQKFVIQSPHGSRSEKARPVGLGGRIIEIDLADKNDAEKLVQEFNRRVHSGLAGKVVGFLDENVRPGIPIFMTPHAGDHVIRVLDNVHGLAQPVFRLTPKEQKILEAVALLHDIGNGAAKVEVSEMLRSCGKRYLNELEQMLAEGGKVNDVNIDEVRKVRSLLEHSEHLCASPELARKFHHIYSYILIRYWQETGRVSFPEELSKSDIMLVAKLSHCHRKKTDLPSDPREAKLAAVFRVCDALDIDQRRGMKNDWGTNFDQLMGLSESQFPTESRGHWEGHRAIVGRAVMVKDGKISFVLTVNDLKKAAAQLQEFPHELAAIAKFYNCELLIKDQNNKLLQRIGI